MATTVARLEAILSANTRDFDRGMDRSQTRMQKVGKVAGVAGLAVAGGLAVGLEKSVKAAMHAETANVRLDVAFKTAKLDAAKYKDQVDKLEASGRKLGFTDEQTKQSLGSLIVATHSMKDASADLSTAQDIARFKNIDLGAATKMLTMVMGGSQRAAKQLGLSVEKSTEQADAAKDAYKRQTDAIKAHFDALGKLTPAEEAQKQAQLEAAAAAYAGEKAQAKVNDKQVTAEAVIKLVNEKLHGQSKAYADTAAGGMAQYRAQIDHVEVAIGKQLLPKIVALTGFINDQLTALDNLKQRYKFQYDQLKSITPLWANIGYFVKIAADDFHDLYKWMKNLEEVKKLPGMISDLKGAIQDALKPVEAFVHAFVELVKALKWVLDHAGKIGDAFGAFGGAFSKIPHGDVDANMFKSVLGGGGMGPKSINAGLYDELSRAQGMGLHLTSGYRKGAVTKHGTRSDHSVYPSKAIDVADGPSQMARFFRSLIGDRGVKQAFYDPIGSIFGGVLSSYREGGHSDHVHVATYDRGGWLRPGWNLAYNGLGRPEPVGYGGDIHLSIDGQRLFSWFRGEKQKRERRGDSF